MPESAHLGGGLAYFCDVSSGSAVELANDACRVVIDPERGGRLAELWLWGANLLVPATADSLTWGCYPMVPYAGRVRHGQLTFEDRTHQLPVTLGAHAIHGFGFVSPWTVRSRTDTTVDLVFHLGDPWPWEAEVRQRITLTERAVELEMMVSAKQRQPVCLGWHPWFVRELEGADPHARGTVDLDIDPVAMYELDDEAIPTGHLIEVPPGPWDNCFTGMTRAHLTWGEARLTLTSDASHWVVYTEPEHAVCVEPQTGPPNDVNTAPHVVGDRSYRSTGIRASFAWA